MAGVSFSGLASGIDGDAIIKAMIEAKQLASIPMKNVVESNKRESDALAELNTRLLAVRDAVKEFRTLAGSSISKRGTSSDDSAVSVSASSNAVVSSSTVEVLNMAKSSTLSFNGRFVDSNDPIEPGLSEPAKITFSLGQGSFVTSFEVDLDDETTLRDVIAQINEKSNGRLVASAVNVGTETTPEYALLVTGTETGVEKGAVSVSVDGSLSSNLQDFTVAQAEDAVFTVSGLGTITRSTNNISGVLPGVTFELKRAGAGPVLLSITDDAEKTTARMETVVGTINELIKYVKDNDTISRTEEEGKLSNTYGALAKVRVDNQSITSLRDAIKDTNSQGIGTSVFSFADLGLTTERDGTYKFDKDKFLTALASDPTGSGTILTRFGDRLANTNGLIDEYTKFQGQIDIARRANDDENKMINDRLDRIQANLDRQADAMRLMFANLETKFGKLNSTADALTSLIASTQRTK